ncbi:putative nucleotidyltransferase-like protein [Gelidibacter algens]|uniref:Putative nucleotidyltransferase-like protein n=2 Tax=Gelidibacter algens TaxID=49280 RepID=A0A1A7R411_9FLAO|nr:hypothetical protein A9996_09370 [Gelidibacter algens]RAJ22231.1 putative nucleotidyltransferase-like protein [Gelidibacter algens]
MADILSFETNGVALMSLFNTTETNWDAVVTIASQHLMLPALYCQLRAKGLLSYIPKDLELYLEELTAINRNRNEVLITEAHAISELFHKSQIDHVFIKGLALIAGHTFKDRAERMIGDIDILVAPNQVQQAFTLLEVNGYTQTVAFNYIQKNYRHLSRQIHPKKMGAVELHHETLVHKYRLLIDTTSVLQKKQHIEGIFVPSIEDAIRIAIFTSQINDKAHLFGYIKFKSVYDCLALELHQNKELLHVLSSQKHAQCFLELSSLYFPELKPFQTNGYSKFIKSYYRYKLTHPKMGHYCQKTLYLLDAVGERLNLLVGNKSYRMHVLRNKLNPQKK